MQEIRGGYKMFSGIITALVTPMAPNGTIDYLSLDKLVIRQLEAGVQGLVVNGTTGESPVLTQDERRKTLETVIKRVNHQVPVIAGTGSNSTQTTLDETKIARETGADACLIITPYYNKPTQEGLYQHFKMIAESVPIPIILYNAPGRTGCDLLPSTVEKLANIANIVGLKECNMTLARIEELMSRVSDKLDLLTGNDEDGLGAMLMGFKGIISVVSNIAPHLMGELVKTKSRLINQRLLGLHEGLFYEANPIPCKWLMHEMGLIPPGIRLPLTVLSEKYHDSLHQALQKVLPKTGEKI